MVETPTSTSTSAAAIPAVPYVVTPDAQAQLEKYHETVVAASAATGSFSGVLSGAAQTISGWAGKLGAAKDQLERYGATTRQGSAALFEFASSTINVRRAFENLGSVDTGFINTFGNQLEYVRSALESNTVASSVYNGAMDKIKGTLKTMGVPPEMIASYEKVKGGLFDLLKQQMANADNGLRLSNVYMHQMAASGSLNTAYEKAGDTLGNLNNAMQEQADMLDIVSDATRKSPEQVEAAFGKFSEIPGAINSVIEVTGSAGDKLSGLTAIMKAADGVSRNFADVNKDVAQATRLFSTDTRDAQRHMKDAMEATVGLTQLSNNLGISFDAVHSGITSASEGLMEYTDAGDSAYKMTKGLRDISHEMAGGLMAAGMSGEKAMRTIGTMTKSMEGMNTAQKAFLSAQTGGPGGLMGAAQIEQMIRKGDTKEIMDKVMSTLQKQMGGNIVSLEDASQSQAAAAQYNKQKTLLDSGPLGSLVKATGVDSSQMIDFMKNKQLGKSVDIKPMADTGVGLADAINKGTSWQEKTAGAVFDLVKTLKSFTYSTMGEATSFQQDQQAVASTGDENRANNSPAVERQRIARRNTATEDALRGGENAYNAQTERGPASVGINRANQLRVLTNAIGVGKTIPEALKTAGAAQVQEGAMAIGLGNSPAPRTQSTADKTERMRNSDQSRKVVTSRVIQKNATQILAPAATAPTAPTVSSELTGAMEAQNASAELLNPSATNGAEQKTVAQAARPTASPASPNTGLATPPVTTTKNVTGANGLNVKINVEISPEQTDHERSMNSAPKP